MAPAGATSARRCCRSTGSASTSGSTCAATCTGCTRGAATASCSAVGPHRGPDLRRYAHGRARASPELFDWLVQCQARRTPSCLPALHGRDASFAAIGSRFAAGCHSRFRLWADQCHSLRSPPRFHLAASVSCASTRVSIFSASDFRHAFFIGSHIVARLNWIPSATGRDANCGAATELPQRKIAAAPSFLSSACVVMCILASVWMGVCST